MKILTRLRPRLPGFLLLLSLLVAACHLGQEEKVENTLSFPGLVDTLKKYDSVVIEVKDAGGKTVKIFEGKVDDAAKIDNLAVPGWDGGAITIIVTGFNAGNPNPAYRQETGYDGTTKATEKPVIVIDVRSRLSSPSLLVQMVEGQTLALPRVDITPANLANQALDWSSSNPAVVSVNGQSLVAGTRGTAQVTVRLAQDTLKHLTFDVQVSADTRTPEAIVLDPRSLSLAANGATGKFTVEVKPTTASAEILWSLSDSTVAAQLPDGSFQGKKQGWSKVTASVKGRPAIFDTALIQVTEPVKVTEVRFKKETVKLFVGGAPEILAVDVLPEKANTAVTYTLSDSTKARVKGDTLTPLAAGTLTVTAASVEDPGKTDVLEITIEVPIAVTGVEIDRDTLTLYRKGEAKAVPAKVLPADAPQAIRWTSATPSVATVDVESGLITPVSGGTAQITATSLADNTKKDVLNVTVKVDVPKIAAGADVTISAGGSVTFLPVVTQEYGHVAKYYWDLDGDLDWDDSADVVVSKSFTYTVAKEYAARFRVLDTEGNEATATRRVLVVSSAAVVIHEPKDNSYTNQRTIPVEWSVNTVRQTAQATETLLLDGRNVITRTAKDSAGKDFSASVVVFLDTLPPAMPIVTGASPTNVKPKWSWQTGGSGGSGDFRYRLGDANFPANASSSRETTYTLAGDPVSGTTYTLYVQERDLAGNWSPTASRAIVFDVTQPVVAIQTPKASGTHYSQAASVSLTGTAAGPVAITRVTYKVGNAAAQNATFASGAWSTPALSLSEGVATLVTVTAFDQAGNSGEAALTLFHDATPPAMPTLSTVPAAQIGAAKATFGWTANGDGATGSGLSGRYRYNVNGGAWKDTSAVLLTDLPLVEGNNTFSVQAQDRALNWSASAVRVVKVDVTGPVLTLTSHTNPQNLAVTTATLSGTVRDSVGVASMTVSGQASGSGTVTVTGTTWTTAQLTLSSGQNTLVLTATDAVGNTRTLNAVLNVNIPAPAVVITSPANNFLTQAASITVHYTVGGSPASKDFTLVEGSNSLVVESAPNASGNVGKDTVIVRRDDTDPNSPNLVAVATPTQGAVAWTWTTRGDNNGGAGMRTPAQFQYQLNGGAWTATTGSGLSLSNQAEGSYTLVVQEQDLAGNWSPSSTARTIVVDKTGPVVTITSPADGWITSNTTVFVTWTEKDGAAAPVSKSGTFNLPSDNAANPVPVVSAADAAGNTTTAYVSIVRRSGVIFVRSGGASGDGSSWDSPLNSLQAALAIASSTPNRKQIWMRAGNYVTNSSDGFVLTAGVQLYGGFGDAGTPNSITQRDSLLPYRTVLQPRSQTEYLLQAHGADLANDPLRNMMVNSIKLEGHSSLSLKGVYVTNARDFLFSNVEFTRFFHNNDAETGEITGSPIQIAGNGRFVNCYFRYNSGNQYILEVNPPNWNPGDYGMTFHQCSFSDNGQRADVVFMLNGETTWTKCSFLDYPDPGNGRWQLRSNAPFQEAVVTFRDCTVRGGVAAIMHSGTLNYDSSNKEP